MRGTPSQRGAKPMDISPTLYGHPFSSFTEKVLVALYESDTPFTFRVFGPDDPQAEAEWARLSPMKRFPVMVDGDRTLIETSIIIEHLALTRPGAAALLPRDPQAALEVRLMDRLFDGYVMTPMLTLALNESRPAAARDAFGADRERDQLSGAYAWLDGVASARVWAAGDGFSLADCAAAPALLFAHW
ncbi:MAG TPA: glutathione S-transferase family protein, partial [Caulobacteraceae bacterium]|nr:glutathione S-transferase family protein [Caulobacteraceae bacterium]